MEFTSSFAAEEKYVDLNAMIIGAWISIYEEKPAIIIHTTNKEFKTTFKPAENNIIDKHLFFCHGLFDGSWESYEDYLNWIDEKAFKFHAIFNCDPKDAYIVMKYQDEKLMLVHPEK